MKAHICFSWGQGALQLIVLSSLPSRPDRHPFRTIQSSSITESVPYDDFKGLACGFYYIPCVRLLRSLMSYLSTWKIYHTFFFVCFFISVNSWISVGRPIFVTPSPLPMVPPINHLEFAGGPTLGLVWQEASPNGANREWNNSKMLLGHLLACEKSTEQGVQQFVF